MIKPVFSVLVVLLTAIVAHADNWTQFRGATGDGVSSEVNLPTRWSATEGIKWRQPVPGRGNSSPVVTSKRVDLTTQTDDNKLWVLSFDKRTGQLLKQTEVGTGVLAAKGPKNLYVERHNAASPTPIADEEHIWAYFGTGLIVCVQADSGQVVWQRDLAEELGEYDITFGMASSPRLFADTLFINCMTKGVSYVLALDTLTGNDVWKTTRDIPAADDGPDAYSTPTVFSTSTGRVLLVSGSDHVNAYHLATGKELWRAGGLAISSPYGRIIASPVGADDIVVATSANPGGGGKGRLLGLRYGTQDEPLWKADKSTPDAATSVIVGQRVFGVAENGVGTCWDLYTGERLWQKRVGKEKYFASPVSGDGMVYFLNTSGDCTVVAQNDNDGKVLSTNSLGSDPSYYASPAISDELIFLRNYEQIVAISGS